MQRETEIHETSWQGIALSVSYSPVWLASYRAIYGYDLAHIGVRGPCPLPCQATG